MKWGLFICSHADEFISINFKLSEYPFMVVSSYSPCVCTQLPAFCRSLKFSFQKAFRNQKHNCLEQTNSNLLCDGIYSLYPRFGACSYPIKKYSFQFMQFDINWFIYAYATYLFENLILRDPVLGAFIHLFKLWKILSVLFAHTLLTIW